MRGLAQVVFFLALVNGSVISCAAQDAYSNPVAAALSNYIQENVQEKIYTHTDKSFYVCGEIIWYKLYNVDAATNRPANISKLAYVELLDGNGQPVLQAKIELQDGLGKGSFFLPFSLSSGNYTLRVYTNWMKNFDTQFFFEKQLTIVNTLKRLPAAESKTSEYNIRFFPEGGNLVAGLETRVAFHAVDQYGKAAWCQGIVYNQDHDSITSFTSGRFGMGSFRFKPVEGHSYNTVVKDANGSEITRELPAVYETGYTMQLVQADSQYITINIASAGQKNNTIFLLGHGRQSIQVAQSKKLVNGKAELALPVKDLREGVTHFTLFDENHRPLCERLYFKRPETRMNIDVRLDQLEYATRKKIGISITTLDTGGQPIGGDLSVSVFRTDSLQVPDDADIQSYFWLSSDLHGKVESPSYYFNSNDDDAQLNADNLMLTHGWSRFKWENVIADNKPGFRFLPEYEGMLVTGKISDKYTGVPAANVKVFLSIPGEKFVFRTTTSDASGNFLFNVGKFYGRSDIVVQAQKDPGVYLVDIKTPFSVNKESSNSPAFSISEKWKEDLLSYSVSSQVENLYTEGEKQRFSAFLTKDTTRFYGRPDKTYWLDDYTRFISLEEVMREYVAEVRVRKERDSFYYRVRNGAFNIFFEKEPLTLLDGVPVFDIKKLMEFDPLKIKKLDVVTKRFFTGNDGIEGIISYSTYDGNLGGFNLDAGAIVLEYEGLQLNREFYSPSYESNEKLESPLPDFRNVLFWAPGIITDSKGLANMDFYSSDRPGTYAIVVQGMTTDGLAGSSVHFFRVNK
ncbi:MAG TPA: carboxypeptidase-like regulatory domain-containing protein [Chitinophagaceae bacterium]|nr:carboxypeptidase-like regulatory domain-containing protein [Chitinophagaceae bacterium]